MRPIPLRPAPAPSARAVLDRDRARRRPSLDPCGKVSSGSPRSRGDLGAARWLAALSTCRTPGTAHVGRRHRHGLGQDGDVHGTVRAAGLRRGCPECRHVLAHSREHCSLFLAVSRQGPRAPAASAAGRRHLNPEVSGATGNRSPGSGRRRRHNLAADGHRRAAFHPVPSLHYRGTCGPALRPSHPA